VIERVFLAGLSGSGKTTVAELLGSWLGLPWYDIDGEIERAMGCPIAELWSAEGEPAFRAAERGAVERLAARSGPAVLALGGGTLENAASFAQLSSWGTGVWLDAPPEALAERLGAAAAARPLLAGRDPVVALGELVAARGPRLEALHHRVDAEGRPPAAVAVDVLRALGATPPREIAEATFLGRGTLSQAGGLLAGLEMRPGEVLVATDGRVWSLHGRALEEGLAASGWEVRPVALAEGEAAKSPDALAVLWRALVDTGADRDSPLAVLGGGSVSDVAGLAAATYKRGIPLAIFPTTLLAQSDAAIGGKNAIDFAGIKNVIGTFHPPVLVASDSLCLLTLSDRDYLSGWAEVVKSGVIGDPALLDLCEREADAIRARRLEIVEEAVGRAARVKAAIVARDPRETDQRRVLNLGHTLGHAIEATAEGALTHGEAVAIGIGAAARFAEAEGLARPGVADRLSRILENLGLPVRPPIPLARATLLARIAHDKKRAGGVLHAVLPIAPGEVVVHRLENGAIGRWVASALA
jgi:shikimate kinase/3-dehydroquinate synthase